MDFMLPDLLIRGGWPMYPILLCSVVAMGVTIERLIMLRSSRVLPPAFIGQMTELLSRGDRARARQMCLGQDSALARICLAALDAASGSRQQVMEAVQEVGRQEAAELERYLSVLSTVVGMAPLLGLFGTVLGMIGTFNTISFQGVGNPGALAGGISQALLCTAGGLGVAIPALALHRYLASRADRLTLGLDKACWRVVQLLDRGAGQ